MTHNADELEREAQHDDELADEHREDNPVFADYLYQRAHWKRYLARDFQHHSDPDNEEESE